MSERGDRERDDRRGGAGEVARGRVGHRRASTWGERYFPKPGPVGRAFAAYCAIVHEKFRRFTLTGFARTREPIDLRDVYVPLLLAREPADDAADDDAVRADAGSLLTWLERHTSLVISGLPGSGKTTLVRELVAELSAARTSPTTTELPDHLPVPILLRDHDLDALDGMDALIERWFAREARDDRYSYDRAALQPFFDQGRFVLVLDGLDELGTLARRERVWRWLSEYQRARGGQGYYLVTSRPAGLDGLAPERDPGVSLAGLASGADVALGGYRADARDGAHAGGGAPLGVRLHIRPLSDDAIGKFCGKFFDLPIYRREDGARKAAELRRAVLDRPDLRVLARRPAFLTMMAFVHANVGELPDTRAELYDRLVETYLHVLDQVRDLDDKQPDPDRPRWPHADKRNLLAMLAFLAQRGTAEAAAGAGGDGGDAPDTRLFAWDRAELMSLMAELLAHPTFKVARPEHAASLLDYFLARTGLLAAPAEGVIQFGHLSFQEYLAAVYLHARASTSPAKPAWFRANILARVDAPGWDEVATLFMAVDARATQGEGHRALLLELDLSSARQAAWLSRLLGGREVPFAPEERSLWLAGLLGAAMAYGWPDLGVPLARLPENHEPVARWFRAACAPWRDDVSPLARLRAALSAARPAGGAMALLGDDPEETPDAALRERILGADLWDQEVELLDALAMAAFVAGDANAADMQSLDFEHAVPPTLMWVRDGQLVIANAYWALQGLIIAEWTDVADRSRWTTRRLGVAEALHSSTHLAAWLVLTPWQAPALGLPPTDYVARLGRQALFVALALGGHQLLAGTTASTSSFRRWSDVRVALSRRAREHDPLLAPGMTGGRVRAMGLLEPEMLMLCRILAILAQGLELPDSPPARAARASTHRLRAVQLLAPELDEVFHLDLVRTLAPASSIPLQRVPPALWRDFDRLFCALACLVEARTLGPDGQTPFERQHAAHALATLLPSSARSAHSELARYRRELAECRELGLLPIDVLQEALADDGLWTHPWTLDDALDELSRQLEAWCEQAERAAATAEDPPPGDSAD